VPDIRCMMLTGHNNATAKWVSDQVGLDEYFAEVLPKDKAAKVKEVPSRGRAGHNQPFVNPARRSPVTRYGHVRISRHSSSDR
jgi:magnesium-transporting ATPase (P-type)